MACLAIPAFPPFPSLGGLSLTPPALPGVDLSVNLCCRVFSISITPPAPLGALVLAVPGAAAVVQGINDALAVVDAYIAAIPLRCPRE